jgi:hypothetical protein
MIVMSSEVETFLTILFSDVGDPLTIRDSSTKPVLSEVDGLGMTHL